MAMYSKSDFRRIIAIEESSYRHPIRRDYARLLHSPSFRRLQGKTQLYPGSESDFFRNRLTHSLEVAQIAKTIALKLNHSKLDKLGFSIKEDICEFAGLAHDLGHPPFGHQGEAALDDCMRDFGGFEGNAQTLRILSRLEKKREFNNCEPSNSTSLKVGLNLTFRSLASVLKYDNVIPLNGEKRDIDFRNKPIKGYYHTEIDLVEKIKKNVLDGASVATFKTIECQIMDIADDIAYSTYDLEDGLKAGFYHPTSFFTYPREVYENVAEKVSRSMDEDFSAQDVLNTLYEIFEDVYSVDPTSFDKGETEDGEEVIIFEPDQLNSQLANMINYANTVSRELATNGELRGELTSRLVNKAIEGVKIKIDRTNPSQSKVFLHKDIKRGVETLKNFTYESQILSPRLKVAEYRGKEIVKKIFDALSEDEGWRLLPADHQHKFHLSSAPEEQKRCICDFIAGMTDKYAIEFYGRLTSERPETIFKPF